MRGARLCLVSTTLLGMVDASLGGKTGIDLLGLKNLAGSFYPANLIVLPLEVLDTLPEREWKSGMAELIKTAVLDSDEFLESVKKLVGLTWNSPAYRETLKECISRAVAYKGRIVEADPCETGIERPLLNLGHTFGHALEASVGLGTISHGEAVAWGMVRACEMGMALGITPPERAREIREVLTRFGYETRAPHPLVKSSDAIMNAIKDDKKKQSGKLRFVVPSAKGAQIVAVDEDSGVALIRKTIKGESSI